MRVVEVTEWFVEEVEIGAKEEGKGERGEMAKTSGKLGGSFVEDVAQAACIGDLRPIALRGESGEPIQVSGEGDVIKEESAAVAEGDASAWFIESDEAAVWGQLSRKETQEGSFSGTVGSGKEAGVWQFARQVIENGDMGIGEGEVFEMDHPFFLPGWTAAMKVTDFSR